MIVLCRSSPPGRFGQERRLSSHQTVDERRKNLVMGLFSRMTFDQLEKFLGSLRRTTFHGDVCAFVDEVTPETVATLVAHGVLIARAYPSARPELPPLSSRFFDYLEFLACHADEYEHVMLTDLRDVVFQSDPFAVPLPADIVFAQERCLIGARRPTTADLRFLRRGGGAQLPIASCHAPAPFGTTSGIMRYLVAMTRELRDRQPPFVVGLDQAVHNYIIRMRPLRHAWVDTTDLLVATMHFVRDESVRTTPQGVLIDGRLVPVEPVGPQYGDAGLPLRPHVHFEAALRPGPSPMVSPAVVAPPNRPERQIVAFYHRPRDTGWLAPFFGSLRCAGFAGGMHCVGAFDADELALLDDLNPSHPVGDAERRWISTRSPTCAFAA